MRERRERKKIDGERGEEKKKKILPPIILREKRKISIAKEQIQILTYSITAIR